MFQVKSPRALELEYILVPFVVLGSCCQIYVSVPIKVKFMMMHSMIVSLALLKLQMSWSEEYTAYGPFLLSSGALA